MYVLIQAAEALDYEMEGEDEQILARIRAGERALFAQLYRRYYTRTFALAFGMTGKREQADDMTQEIILRAYERLDSYHGGSSFATWFYRLAVNHCLNYCRRERRHHQVIRNVDDAECLPFIFNVGAEDHMTSILLQHQLQTQVHNALLTLKPEMRVMIVMNTIFSLASELDFGSELTARSKL